MCPMTSKLLNPGSRPTINNIGIIIWILFHVNLNSNWLGSKPYGFGVESVRLQEMCTVIRSIKGLSLVFE